MRTRNLNPLFNPLEFELKYQVLLGLVGALCSFVISQESLSIYVKAPVGVLFVVLALMIHRRMIKELRTEPQVRKGYLTFAQVRYWSFVFIIIFFTVFYFAMENFI